MTIWTPSTVIRVKVIGLAWRGDELLLAEVEESNGQIKGARPLGGGVEFGETREQALHREFEEELGCGITVVGPWHSFENIYEHEGATGHEYLFAANIRLANSTLYAKEKIAFFEDHGIGCWARWWSPTALPAGVDLYPRELLALIDAGVVAPDR